MRLLPKVIAALLGAGVLVLSGVVGWGHIQIRRVAPPLPTVAELLAIRADEGGPVSVRFVNTSSQALPAGTLGHTVVLVEWANGDLFMIDAGMDRETAVEFGRLIEVALGGQEVEAHGSIAELVGDDVDRVVGVAFTHLHSDHTQGIVPFCEARGAGARLYQTPWQADLHNHTTRGGAALMDDSCLEPGETVAGSDGLLRIPGHPGFAMLGLGGHTPGSTLFAIAGRDRLWLLSGDIANVKADLLANRGKGFVYSTFIVPEDTARTEALRLWLRELDARDDMSVIVSHDVDAARVSGMAEYER